MLADCLLLVLCFDLFGFVFWLKVGCLDYCRYVCLYCAVADLNCVFVLVECLIVLFVRHLLTWFMLHGSLFIMFICACGLF